MDFLKKNLGFTIVMGVALVMAVILAVKLQQTVGRADEAARQVDQLKSFAETEQRAAYSATSDNLEISEANAIKARQEYDRLAMALYARSQVDFNPNVSGIECKNLLIEGVRFLRLQVGRKMPEADYQGAASFSFGEVIASEKLPDRVAEVPVLMKQIEIVKEIVKVILLTDLEKIQDLKRLGGVGTAHQDGFEVMPFSLTVQGRFSAIKDFLTRLQSSSQYFFIVRNVSFSAVEGGLGVRLPAMAERVEAPGTTPAGHGRPFEPAATRRRNEPAPGLPGGPPAVAEIPSRDERRLSYGGLAAATIRFDFVEFKNPAKEN